MKRTSTWADSAFASVLAAAAGLGCNLDRNEGILMAAGSYGDLAVILSDESLRPAVKPFIDRLNQPQTFVIREELPFNIDFFVGDKWKLGRNYKNILFVVRWGDGGSVQKEAERLLSQESLNRLQTDQGGFAQFKDPYARYQFGLLASAKDRNTLASLLRRNVEWIHTLIAEKTTERLIRRHRHEGLHETLMQQYWDNFRFTLEIPQTYRENQVQPDNFAAIEWVCNGPTRGITLAWDQTPDPEADLADRDRLLAFRRQLGEIVHDEDIVDLSLAWQDTTLGVHRCVKLTGAWTGRSFDGGGPFWCYFMADRETGRLFCLDLLTYAPGMDKLPYFREMQAIAATFALQLPKL